MDANKNKKRPNMVFYFSDQQRHDTVGAYDRHAREMGITPNLDALAKTGVKFEYAFTPQPVCGPARACIQTGTFATQNGCFTNGRALDENAMTIAKYLGGAGYDTGYAGKWHLASNHAGTKEEGTYSDYATAAIPKRLRGGYGYWRAADVLEFTSHGYGGYVYDGDMGKIEFEGYRCDAVTDFALEFIENKTGARDEDRPFFLFVSHIEPHHQNDRERFEGPEGSAERFANFHLPEDLKGAKNTEPDFDEHFANYLGCCNSLDHNLGRVVAALEQKGIFEDTVIIYTSDHSCHFRTRNGEYKRSCHENSIRIPMVIRGGPFVGGLEVSNLVSLIDLPATVLELAGLEIPGHFMGRPLTKAIEPDHIWENEIYTQISESKLARSIRTPKWKYSVMSDESPWAVPAADVYHEDFLYDLENDPHEQNNLVGDAAYKKQRQELARMLVRHMVRAGENVPVIRPK